MARAEDVPAAWRQSFDVLPRVDDYLFRRTKGQNSGGIEISDQGDVIAILLFELVNIIAIRLDGVDGVDAQADGQRDNPLQVSVAVISDRNLPGLDGRQDAFHGRDPKVFDDMRSN